MANPFSHLILSPEGNLLIQTAQEYVQDHRKDPIIFTGSVPELEYLRDKLEPYPPLVLAETAEDDICSIIFRADCGSFGMQAGKQLNAYHTGSMASLFYPTSRLNSALYEARTHILMNRMMNQHFPATAHPMNA